MWRPAHGGSSRASVQVPLGFPAGSREALLEEEVLEQWKNVAELESLVGLLEDRHQLAVRAAASESLLEASCQLN